MRHGRISCGEAGQAEPRLLVVGEYVQNAGRHHQNVRRKDKVVREGSSPELLGGGVPNAGNPDGIQGIIEGSYNPIDPFQSLIGKHCKTRHYESNKKGEIPEEKMA